MALTVKVDPGTHTIRITKSGYFPIKFSVTTEAGKTYNISRTLIPTNAVTITKAEIKPSEPKVGDTVDLEWGARNNAGAPVRARIKVTFNGQTKTSSEITVSAGSTAGGVIKLGSFTSAKSVSVTVEAQVYVSEHENGAGWYTTDTKTITFTVSERKATITITTSPSGAAVYIDGVYKGTT